MKNKKQWENPIREQVLERLKEQPDWMTEVVQETKPSRINNRRVKSKNDRRDRYDD